jgi:phosphoribosylanthranilate isomerase
MFVILSDRSNLIRFILYSQEGQPRYASENWVRRLSVVAKRSNMKLAAHLCGARVNDVLEGKTEFLSTIVEWGFQRVQINATAVNGVDTSRLAQSVEIFSGVVQQFPYLEFILQKNDETKPLWEGLLNYFGTTFPTNVSMLVDESKGTGVLASSWPSPPKEYRIGYAGGIGPHNIERVLQDVLKAGNGHDIWIDMESSLRSMKNGKDVFDLDKCYQCIAATCEATEYEQPSYLV